MPLFPLVPHCVIVIAGPRGSGKSYLQTALLANPEFYNRYDKIYIFSPSLKLNNDYWNPKLNSYPNLYRCSNFSESTLELLFQEQANLKELEISEGRSGRFRKDRTRCPHILVVLDDIIDSHILDFRGVIDKYAERGRHVNISLAGLSQRISAVSRSVRLNSDYFILFRPDNISEIEQFLEQYVSRNHKRTMRQRVHDVYDVPYQFILVDNHSERVNEKLKISTADEFLRNEYDILEIDDLD
jgi:hypothetical protein